MHPTTRIIMGIKMHVKSGIHKLALSALLLALPGIAHAQSLWDKINDSGEVVCGAVVSQPPTSWKDTATNQYEGTAPATCRAIVADLGADMGKELKIRWEEFSFSTVVLDLQSGRIDIAGGMSATEERKKVLDMPGPLYSYPDALVYRKGFEPSENWEDYNKPALKVASLQGASSERTVNKLLPNAVNQSFKSVAEMYLSVQAGTADFLVVGLAQGLMAMSENGSAFGGLVYPSPKHATPSGLGIRKDGDGRLNQWLQAWSEKRTADGTMLKLVRDNFAKAGIDITLLEGSGL